MTAVPVSPTVDDVATEQERLERALAGRYRLVRAVARTRMGVVFQGWEHGLERHVAIKSLAADRCRDADARGRFRREARVMAQLAHASIAPVLASGDSDGVCWYAMPWFEGGTLAERLTRVGRLTVAEAREILADLADALAFAHSRGVIHRDIKAENVLFAPSGRAILTDFGVATVHSSEHSRAEANQGMGTPHYMAPEHLLGDLDADHRGDLYALGVLGYRMLAGRFPFEGSSDAIAAQHLSRPADPVQAFRSDIPETLADVINRCLAKRPSDRWPDAASVRAALFAERPARRFGIGRLRLLLL